MSTYYNIPLKRNYLCVWTKSGFKNIISGLVSYPHRFILIFMTNIFKIYSNIKERMD